MPASPALRRRGPTLAVLLVLLATQGSLVLRWLVPVNPVSLTLASFDGGLFERLAASVANHDWLGPLTVTTLAKGPAYPVFMALMKWLHVPLPVGEQAVYLLGAGGVALCVWLVSKRPLAAAIVYALLAFEPSNFGLLASQITRENLYTGLTLLFVSGVFITVWLALARRAIWLVAPAAVVTGLAGAAFWLCREEGVWLGPAVAVIGLGLVVPRLLADGWDWRFLGRLAVAGAVLAVAFAAPIAVVHKKNHDTYGVSITTDLASGTFPEAYAAMSRVRGVKLTPFVPFNAAQRAAVYRVSPTARLLQSRLEDPTNGWRAYPCGAKPCNDYAASIAAWAVRDAAHAAGKFDDEPTMQRFFGAITKEVTAACDDGKLRCARKLPTSMQSFDRASASAVVRNGLGALWDLPLHPFVTHLSSEATVNQVEDADRPTINAGLAHAPSDQADAQRAARVFEGRVLPFRVLRFVYQVLFLGALAIGLLGLAVTVRNRRMRTTWLPLQIAVVGLLGSIAARLVLFAIIDTSQYDVEIRYHLVTRSLLFTSALLAALPAVAAIWPKLRVKDTIIN